MITLSGVTKVYPRRGQEPVVALDDINLEIPTRDIHGIVGESGSGKSVTAMSIVRLHPPHITAYGSNSRIEFDGVSVLDADEKTLRRLSMGVTAVLGIIVFVLAIAPPSLIWLINMFAFGGLETAFFWVLVFGLFTKWARRTGALAAMAGGTVVYCAAMAAGFKPFGLHPIAVGITVSLLFFLAGSYWERSRET